MELTEVISTRRSIRSFTDEPVTDEIIETILRAAMAAPSAGNQQPWQFIVTRNRQTLDAVPDFHPFAKMMKKAPVAIVVCGDPDGKKWPDFWVQDCSAATQNLLLAARDLGLGTVWTGVYPLEERMAGARTLFGIPETILPFAIVPVGWPEKGFANIDRFKETLVHWEKWEGG